MADSLKGVDGFFRYIELHEMGMTDDKIEAALKARALSDFEARTLRVQSVVERAFAQRSEDGEAVVFEMESAPDISEPARRRIEASKLTYKDLMEQSQKCEAHIEEGKRLIRINQVLKADLSKTLGELDVKLKRTPSETPVVDVIRQIGAAYGSHCSTK